MGCLFLNYKLLAGGTDVYDRLLGGAARTLGGGYGRQDRPPRFPSESGAVFVSGRRIAYLRWPGKGDPLVLLHGVGDTAWIWARVAGALAGEREVVALTTPGHGESGPAPPVWALAPVAEALASAARQLVGDRFHLGGHSLGGKLALYLAAVTPECVSSLTLADPVAPAGFNPLLSTFPRLVESAFAGERRPFATDEEFYARGRARFYLPHGDALDRVIWESKFERVPSGGRRVRLSEEDFRAILAGPIREDIRPLLEARPIEAPVLLLRPTFSLSFWPGEFVALEGIVNFRSLRVSGDHAFINSNPVATEHALRSFL